MIPFAAQRCLFSSFSVPGRFYIKRGGASQPLAAALILCCAYHSAKDLESVLKNA